MDCGYKHYKRLMAEFGTVVDVFLGLDKTFQVFLTSPVFSFLVIQ